MSRNHTKITSFMQRFVNQRQLTEFEVTQTTMNKATGPARSAATEVARFEKQCAEAAHRRVTRDSDSVNAAANDN